MPPRELRRDGAAGMPSGSRIAEGECGCNCEERAGETLNVFCAYGADVYTLKRNSMTSPSETM